MKLSDIAIKAKDHIGEDDSRFTILAESSLQKMEDISNIVEEKLKKCVDYSDSFLLEGQRKATRFIRSDLNLLRQRPIIAKCVIYYEKENKFEELYICSGIPPAGIKNVISYRHPKGRLASLDIGQYDLDEELGLKQQREIDITKIQGAEFKVKYINEAWDSIDTTYRDIFFGENSVRTIEGSLRKWLQKAAVEEGVDILSEILATEEQNINIINGIKRDVLESMSLREQPILDSFQDHIFRMPLQSVLFLQGPAGSGKTTTLIRRIGQKLDIDNGLSEDEKLLAEKINQDSIEEYSRSWIMFTPTILLKDYLRESFNKEGIPAPDNNISTWENYWTVLGRNKLNILRRANFSNGFEHDVDIKNILDTTHPIALYKEFISYFLESHRSDIEKKLANAKHCDFGNGNKIIDDIKKHASLYINKKQNIEDFLLFLYRKKGEIASLYRELRQNISDLIEAQLKQILRTDRTFLSSFYEMKNKLVQESRKEQDDSDEIFTEDSFSADSIARTALFLYKNFVISIAKYKNKNKISSSNKKLLTLVGDKIPSDDVLESVFTLSQKIEFVTIFNNPIEKVFRRISSDYEKFRKNAQAEGKFYSQEAGLKRKIDSVEFDILILINLMLARKLLVRKEVKDNLSDGWLSYIKEIFSCYKAQIYVDEAPDFSLIQLLCMRLLTHPETNSFFACGDFNQRITENGIISLDEFNNFIEQMKISGGKISLQTVLAPYRQTDNLYKFSLAVLKAIHGDYPSDYPENSQVPGGMPPVLGENLEGINLAKWIAARVREIENFLGKVPSIAILVPEENDVSPVAVMIENELRSLNIPVQACHYGQTQGNINAIRVFDIRHIKGLEFEAAFFISLDKLESKYPSLVGNYLYVGATRAATFLGVTYSTHAPQILTGDISALFQKDWVGPNQVC